jgi:hypothetical protein
MRGTSIFYVGVGWLICLATIACSSHSQPAKQPVPAEPAQAPESAAAAPAPDGESAAAGQGMDVGMQFEDKGDKQATERVPPPTQSWKPSKEKKIKAAEQSGSKQ